nr:MAG TPA: hypothetical protein [Bacteriophage sp.]
MPGSSVIVPHSCTMQVSYSRLMKKSAPSGFSISQYGL